jgi:hypothetical protein
MDYYVKISPAEQLKPVLALDLRITDCHMASS